MSLRFCENGHEFQKTSDCPTCPICESNRKPKDGFFSVLAAPAYRALINNNINTIEELSNFSMKEIMNFHGIGRSSIPKLEIELQKKGLKFKDN